MTKQTEAREYVNPEQQMFVDRKFADLQRNLNGINYNAQTNFDCDSKSKFSTPLYSGSPWGFLLSFKTISEGLRAKMIENF